MECWTVTRAPQGCRGELEALDSWIFLFCYSVKTHVFEKSGIHPRHQRKWCQQVLLRPPLARAGGQDDVSSQANSLNIFLCLSQSPCLSQSLLRNEKHKLQI